MTTTDMPEDLIKRALSWAEADPEPDWRREVIRLVDAGDVTTLRELFDGALAFGTAGIRGRVGPGPNRMNRTVVIRTTRALADHLLSRFGDSASRPVLVGFDARPTSRRFAGDAIGVLAAAGIRVIYFPEVAPTPLVAFAAKHLRAMAAVVITASHNPPADNGYKVYGENAAQIIPPDDALISAAIESVGSPHEIPRVESAFTATHQLIEEIPHDIADSYWTEVAATRPDPQTSDIRIVYTPLHGVGGDMLDRMFQWAGHSGLMRVTEQFEPDGSFPTVAFPNPEEDGALDLAMTYAETATADLVIANDPDADRLAIVVPNGGGEWRPLTGNEIGALLGDYVLRNYDEEATPIVINSIVSSPMLSRIAALYGARHEMTLTGFKWIINAGLALEEAGEGRFVFGYEEALGYTIGSTVRDKDGLSAALVFADLAAGLGKAGSSVLERLVEIWDVSGLWVSAQHSVVRPGAEGVSAIEEALARLAARPPKTLGGNSVATCTDYRSDASKRPSWLGAQNLVELSLGEKGRILARPSGTEPKLKIYVDLRGECGDDAFAAHDELSSEAALLAVELADRLGI